MTDEEHRESIIRRVYQQNTIPILKTETMNLLHPTGIKVFIYRAVQTIRAKQCYYK